MLRPFFINRLASSEQFVPLKNQRYCLFVANQKGFKIPCFLSCLYGSELLHPSANSLLLKQ